MTKSIRNILKPKSKKEIENGIRDMSNKKIVNLALQQKSKNIINLALERNLSPELNGKILRWAIKNNEPTLIERLSIKDINLDLLTPVDFDIIVNYPNFNMGFNNNKLIRWSASRGKTSIVKKLLKDSRVDPSDLQNAALLGAEIYEHDNVIALLLKDKRVKRKLSKNQMKKYGIKESLSDILKPKSKKEIIKAATEIEDPDTLLRLCVGRINEPELVKIAIKRGADPNKVSGDVSSIKNSEIIKILLTNPQMRISINSLIYKAIKMNLIDEVIKLIEEKKLNPGQKSSQILVWAVGFGREKLVKKLLMDSRVKPENESESVAEALSIAIARKNNKIVKLLLSDKRIDPSGDYNRPIKVASQFGNKEAVKMLLNDARVDPSSMDSTNNEENFSIKSAAKNNFFDIVKLLLNEPKVREKLSKEELKEYREMAKENMINKIVREDIKK